MKRESLIDNFLLKLQTHFKNNALSAINSVNSFKDCSVDSAAGMDYQLSASIILLLFATTLRVF